MAAEKTVNTPVMVEFAGKEYRVCQITTQDYGELTRYLKSLYIGEVGRSMRVAEIKEDKIIAEIRRLQFEEWGMKGATKKEQMTYYKEKIQPLMSSIDAMSYILFLGLRKQHPDLTLSQANEIVASNPGGMEELIAYVMGGLPVAKPKNAPRVKA